MSPGEARWPTLPARPDGTRSSALLDRALDSPPAEQDALLRADRLGRSGAGRGASSGCSTRAGEPADFLEQPAASYAAPLLAWAPGGSRSSPATRSARTRSCAASAEAPPPRCTSARDPKHHR